jgi:hypothetical protein
MKMKTNLTMKKISLILLGLMAVVFITSCNKTEDTTPQASAAELSFNIEAGQNPGGLKETPCISANKSGNYVMVKLLKTGETTAVDYRLEVFYIGDVPYTNTIKLAPGAYTVQEFAMWNDGLATGSPAKIIAAGVHSTATYAPLINPNSWLTRPLTITAFQKNTMSIELVCYDEAHYADFGFEYFTLDQTVIREQNFFGDFCIKEVKDYNGEYAANSPYVTVLGGAGNILLDLPAIFMIKVYRDNVLTGTFDNNDASKIYSPLKVTYADRIGVTDVFKFELYIMVRVGASYDYVLFNTWTKNDAETIVPVVGAGQDGVVDFVLGNCVQSGSDLVIPPWMNLPETCAYQMVAPTYAPGLKGGYVDATLGVTGGIHDFDFKSDTYASYCANRTVSINWIPYTMNVYSSLYKSKLPTWAQADYSKWEKMNWIINHLDWYSGYSWSDLQQAMWILEDPTWNGSAEGNVPAITTIGIKMVSDANTYGGNYKVPSGGWACIIFIDHNPPGNATLPYTQTMFIKVDP